MKSLKDIIFEKLVINKNVKLKKAFHPKSYEELRDIITDKTQENNDYVDLTDIDISKVPMLVTSNGWSVFGGLKVSTKVVDVTGWDVSHITDMHELFEYCSAQEMRGLEDWDISNVTNMRHMFTYASKNIIPNWYDWNKWEKP